MASDRRRRLAAARLYLVCDRMAPERLRGALQGGVDIVQLRMKGALDREILEASRVMRQLCHEHGALFVVNDRPDLATAVDADGAHVGQDDISVAEARARLGEDRLLGVSTHSPEQIAAACAAGADMIGVGPVNATPTKPGRPAVGLELVGHAARHATVPFFAIGGVDASSIGSVLWAGATRIAVVRAIEDSVDPEGAARGLRAELVRRATGEAAGARA